MGVGVTQRCSEDLAVLETKLYLLPAPPWSHFPGSLCLVLVSVLSVPPVWCQTISAIRSQGEVDASLLLAAETGLHTQTWEGGNRGSDRSDQPTLSSLLLPLISAAETQGQVELSPLPSS